MPTETKIKIKGGLIHKTRIFTFFGFSFPISSEFYCIGLNMEKRLIFMRQDTRLGLKSRENSVKLLGELK